MPTVFALLFAATLTACQWDETPEQNGGTTTPGTAATLESFASMLLAAENAQKAAAAAGSEWLETASLIAQAKRDAEQGHWEIAIELALKAKQQGELAVKQAERESTAWQRRVVH